MNGKYGNMIDALGSTVGKTSLSGGGIDTEIAKRISKFLTTKNKEELRQPLPGTNRMASLVIKHINSTGNVGVRDIISAADGFNIMTDGSEIIIDYVKPVTSDSEYWIEISKDKVIKNTALTSDGVELIHPNRLSFIQKYLNDCAVKIDEFKNKKTK